MATPRSQAQPPKSEIASATHPYAGMCVTQGGRARHALLPDNRYAEARGARERAHEGRDRITGDHIEYQDDTGFAADGDFVDGVLCHGGMILHRR